MKFGDCELQSMLTEAAQLIPTGSSMHEAKEISLAIYERNFSDAQILTEEKLTAIIEQMPDTTGMSFDDSTNLVKDIIAKCT